MRAREQRKNMQRGEHSECVTYGHGRGMHPTDMRAQEADSAVVVNGNVFMTRGGGVPERKGLVGRGENEEATLHLSVDMCLQDTCGHHRCYFLWAPPRVLEERILQEITELKGISDTGLPLV